MKFQFPPLLSVENSQRLVIIDPTIDAPQHLINGVLPGTSVVVLDPQQKSVPQITKALQAHAPIVELHLVSHGAPGQVQWGNGPLTLANLGEYAAELQQWRSLLGEAAAVFFYGCQVAAGELGQQFVQRLSQLLGTGIAANKSVTGSAAMGGNWDLSYEQSPAWSSHRLSTLLPFTATTLYTYPAHLAVDFSIQSTFAAGTNPASVSLGDFNGDSQPDLVTANILINNVSVLLGDGSGGFSSQTTFAAGTFPNSVSVGDFNGDSLADLAVANQISNNVSVLLGDGSGGFSSQTTFAAGSRPFSVSIGDFNGDSLADLAVATPASNNVSVLLGDGSGGFSSQTTFAVGITPFSVSVGDFNGDSQPDLVTANFDSNNVSVLLGDGSSGFSSQTTFAAGTNPSSVSVGDFNGDSQADLVTANNGSNNVSVLLGDGSGGFSSQTTFAVGTDPFSVSVGDFNGDSQADLVTMNFASNNVSVLLGNGSGGFSSQTTFAAGTNPASISVGDFNGDSQADLAVANSSSNNVSVLLNTTPIDHAISVDTPQIIEGDSGSQTLTFTVTRSRFIGSVSSVDFTIAGTAINGSDFTNIGGTSGATTTSGTINFAAGETSKTITLDVLGDTNFEPQETIAITLSNATAAVNTTISTATATSTILNDELFADFSVQSTFAAGIRPSSVSVGDFNGDSLADLAVANDGSNNVSVFLGDGSGGFSSQTTFAAGSRPFSVSVGDFNGDSQADLVTANLISSNVSVLLGNGSGGFSSQTTFAVGTNPRSVSVGDFNGDSQADLAVANIGSTNVSVLLGDGSGGFSSQTTFATENSPISVSVDDFNGDSQADLAVANNSSNNISVLLGDGSGGFSSQTTFAVGTNPRSVSVGDFNGDSQADLAVVNGSNNISVLLGDGSGGFSSQTTFAVGTNPRSVSVDDFNGDSQADLAVVNFVSNNISVLLGDGSGGFSSQTTFATGIDPISVSVGDFNGDGQAEIAVANYSSNNVSILSSNTTLVALDSSRNLVITDRSNAKDDNLTLTTDGTNFTLTDPNNLLTHVISGATGNATNNITVPTTLVTGPQLFINTGGGNDIVSGSSQSETINGGLGADLLNGGAGDDVLTDGASNGTVNPNAAAVDPSRVATTAFTSTSGWSNDTLFPRQIADVNGDNRADIIGFGNSSVAVALGQADGTFGTAFTATTAFARTTGWTNEDQFARRLADVNNDGFADIIGFGNSSVAVALGQADGTFGTAFTATTAFTRTTGWTNEDQFARRLADVNNDGFADIIGFGNSSVAVALGQADGTFGTAFTATTAFTRTSGWTSEDLFSRHVADVNGDGRADIIGFGNSSVAVALGQADGTFGTAFTATTAFARTSGWTSEDLYPRQVADINGDGQADIIGFGRSAVAVALGQADGTFWTATVVNQGSTANPDFTVAGGFNSANANPRFVADVAGNGQADIIGFGNNQVRVANVVAVNDSLLGGAGNDRLVGGAGNDLLTGGADADRFVFDANAAVSGINRITDFNAVEGDRLEITQAAFGITNLSEITFNATTGELFVAGTYNNTLAIFTGQSGFDVNTHITLV
ncbi:FG-GAP-like repeat-containing protein [Acaryochloris marina]|uniref:FG-GAP repeat protein n=1 Tax=Acaryochloris marina (strain MBIC 11017) TaxID=329726 RepID=A8ZQR7_ACAM1|nr:FG-GAP-like repeat-containing protein [Acaryochloris marina]ABW33353.1 FG-GAP repeat protein [Acaryochloris marina MBIC11017]